MLSGRYMTSVKNLGSIFQKIIEGAAPTKFTIAHLKGLGFTSSNDVGILSILKDLNFLTGDGTPTARYHAYRDHTQSRRVLGEAIREAYSDLFLINENISDADRPAVEGKFKQTLNSNDRVASEQAKTFFALLRLADISGPIAQTQKIIETIQDNPEPSVPSDISKEKKLSLRQDVFGGLRYNIEIHLPSTKDVEVFNAIFKSLKEHLLED